MDWWTVLEGFVGELGAGAVILYLGYRFVDSRLDLRARQQRRSEHETERTANRAGALEAVLGELYSNAAQWETVVPILERAEGVPFPLFDITLWDVLAQAPVFSTLARPTVAALIHAYNRMGTANEQCKFLADLDSGSTSLLAHTSVAGRMDDPQVSQIYDQYRGYVDVMRRALLDRLADLKPHLEAAIDAVEVELGVEAIPAAQRLFVGVTSPADAAPLGQPRSIVRIEPGEPG